MVFRCSYCNTYFNTHHDDNECQETIIEMIYQLILKIDRHRLKKIYNDIVNECK